MAFYSIQKSMRKDNRKKKIPDGSKNSLILVSYENQLQENENQILVSNPRHDQELILLIESEQYEAAKELASQHFLSEISENLATAFPFLEEPELNLAFDKALDKLILFVEEQTISLKDGQIEGCPSILQFLKDESLIFIKNQVQHKDKNREDYKAIQAIMKGDDKSFTWAYHAYRSYFLGYAKHNFPKCSHEVVADAYQDALIVLIEDYIRSSRLLSLALAGDYWPEIVILEISRAILLRILIRKCRKTVMITFLRRSLWRRFGN